MHREQSPSKLLLTSTQTASGCLRSDLFPAERNSLKRGATTWRKRLLTSTKVGHCNDQQLLRIHTGRRIRVGRYPVRFSAWKHRLPAHLVPLYRRRATGPCAADLRRM